MPFKSDKQRAFLWSQKPDVARQIAYKQQGGGVYSDGTYDSSAKWWNKKMAGTPQHVGFVDDPDSITERAATNPDDPYGGKFFNPSRQQPQGKYTDLATYYTPDTRQMGRGAAELARIDKNNAALAEKAKEMNFKFADGGMVPPLGDKRKPHKVTQKDRYGNQVTYEYLPEVKPLDQTALAKQAMEMSMEGGVPPMMQMEVGMMADGGHPGEPRGTDTVPAWLTPGEFVVNKEAVDMYGPAIKQMNEHGRDVQDAKHMKEGGWVEALSNPSFYQFAERKPTALELVQQSAQASLTGEQPAEVPGRSIGGLWDALRQIPLKRQEGGGVPIPMSPTEALLRQREGYRDDIYLDSLKKPTVGHGHLLGEAYRSQVGERPFSKKQLDSWFQDDMASAQKSAKKNAKKYGVKWDDLNKREKAALTSQAFQLGETGQGNFENMWTALAAGDKETAALEALDSAWASQTPERAKDLYNALTPGLGFYSGGPVYAYRGYDTAMQDAADIEDPMADLSGGWVPPVVEDTGGWDAGDAALMENYEMLEADPAAAALEQYQQNRAASEAGQTIPNLGGITAYPDIEDTGVKGVVDNAEDAAALAAAEGETVINQVIANTDWTDQYEAAAAQEAIGEVQDNTKRKKREVERQAVETKKWGAMSAAAEAREAADVKHAEAEGLAAAGLHEQAAVAETEAEALEAEAIAAETAVTEAQAASHAHYEAAKAEVARDNKPGPEDDRATLEEAANDQEGNAADNPSKKSEKGTQSEQEVVTAGEEAAKQDPTLMKKAEGFFKGAFSDLFDGKELARMTIMYMGSRALGYSHAGSLNWAAKQYVARLDAKQTSLATNAAALAKSGKYTAESIARYQKSGNLADLQSAAASYTTTGKTMRRTVKGSSVSYQEVKDSGGNILYKGPGGGYYTAAQLENRSQPYEPAFEKGTEEYRARRSRATNDAAGRFEEVWKADDRFRVGDNEWKTNTKIHPKQAADEFWNWAESVGLDPESGEALQIMTQAYQEAIRDGQTSEMTPTRLTPYLEGQYIRENTGAPELFVTNPDKKEGEETRYVRGDLMAKLNESVEFAASKVPALQNLAPHDAASRMYDQALSAWNELTPSVKEEYNNSARKNNESGFYLFMNKNLSEFAAKL